MARSTSPIARSRNHRIVRETILAYAREHPRFTRAELSEASGLAPSTLSRSLKSLQEEGHIRISKLERPGPGRPLQVLEYDPASELVAVVAADRQQLTIRLMDPTGAVHDELLRPVEARVRQSIRQGVEELIGRHGSRIRGVVVAVPGIASGEAGHVTAAPVLGITVHALRERLEATLPVPVLIENDVNLMTLAEAHDQEHGSTVFIYLGEDGIGAGLVLNGQVHRGRGGAAGEIGFLPLDGDQPPSDGAGAFERRWSGSALRASAPRPIGPGQSVIAALHEQTLAGSGEAAALLDATVRAWGKVLVTCSCVLAPDRIVLGGIGAELGEALLQRLTDYVEERVPFLPELRRSGGGADGVFTGGLRLALTSSALFPKANP